MAETWDTWDEALKSKIVGYLNRRQAQQVARDTGHGILGAGEIANALGAGKTTVKKALVELAGEGRVRRLDFANGLFWQSINPLPWERGGSIEMKAKFDKSISACKDLNDLLTRAVALVKSWTPEQREAHFAAQKKAWVKAEMEFGDEGTRIVRPLSAMVFDRKSRTFSDLDTPTGPDA